MKMPEKLVIDTSVAVKWYIPETGCEEASAILDRENSLLAPDLLVAEFGNVIWKKVRKSEFGQSEAEGIIGAFLSTRPVILRPSNLYLQPAFEIANRWNVTVYDALYLAVALEESCPLATSDEKLGRALLGTPLEKTIRVLGAV